MGGMAAQIPIKDDEDANNAAFEKVRSDKEREAKNGHDGTWVAHPALVSIAKKVFDEQLEYPCQLGNKREDINVTSNDLLKLPVKTAGGRIGIITEKGMRTNINVGIFLTGMIMRRIVESLVCFAQLESTVGSFTKKSI